MTYAPYQLNKEAAMKADDSGRIEEAGKYVGVINSLEFVKSTKGTQGVEIDFTANNGSSTRLTLWTIKSDGTELSGFRTLNALMTCAGLRALTPVAGKLQKYDYDQGQVIEKPVTIAQEVKQTPIGLLLQRENYTNQSGQARHQMLLFAAFHPQTELMAAEIYDKKTVPEAIEKVLARLMANPVTNRAGQAAVGASPVGGGYGIPAGQGHTDIPFDDGLPF